VQGSPAPAVPRASVEVDNNVMTDQISAILKISEIAKHEQAVRFEHDKLQKERGNFD
jgi:hypothetical protein